MPDSEHAGCLSPLSICQSCRIFNLFPTDVFRVIPIGTPLGKICAIRLASIHPCIESDAQRIGVDDGFHVVDIGNLFLGRGIAIDIGNRVCDLACEGDFALGIGGNQRQSIYPACDECRLETYLAVDICHPHLYVFIADARAFVCNSL